ncbi:MAG: hypothetical protein BGO01_16710 [Armatimonadetes bacterium 55-13]|nr:aldehyde dehydrogenase family protein [Armatimonadota bacterium]OJU65498.1 MAG: hypothetical protein BGO01_16710 [Armatimonadetes bacterium 55-13]
MNELRIDKPSLIWGQPSGEGEPISTVSPLGTTVTTFKGLSEEELDALFQQRHPREECNVEAFAEALADRLKQRRVEFADAMRIGTGFNRGDCGEMVDGAVELLRTWDNATSPLCQPISYPGRVMELHRAPWGTVSVILPQNAFLLIGLTSLLSALSTGNRIVLRAPSSEAQSAVLLGEALKEVGLSSDLYSLVLCDARDFIRMAISSPIHPLIHLLGSSRHGIDLVARGLEEGCATLVDGDGNTWVYVDKDWEPREAANLLWQGAIRYSGQTCTSINGAVIHPDVYPQVRDHLRQFTQSTKFGFGDEPVGPLFSEGQAKAAEERICESKGAMGRVGNSRGNLVPPTLVEDPDWDSRLVTEGVFAPALWIRSGDFKAFADKWPTNKYPLSVGVCSHRLDGAHILSQLSGAARVMLNGDPSLEHVREPWGGYPASGNNPVSPWIDKYTRVVQLDRPS